MTNMTLAIPEELHIMMRKHRETKWSEVARQALWERAKRLELMDKLLANSKLTEADIKEIGKKIKRGIAKAHGIE